MIYATYRIQGGDWQRIAAFELRKDALEMVRYHAEEREWYLSRKLEEVQRVLAGEQTESDRLKIFLSGRRLSCLDIVGIESAAGMPRDTLRGFLEGNRGLPDKYLQPIIDVLESLCYRNW